MVRHLSPRHLRCIRFSVTFFKVPHGPLVEDYFCLDIRIIMSGPGAGARSRNVAKGPLLVLLDPTLLIASIILLWPPLSSCLPVEHLIIKSPNRQLRIHVAYYNTALVDQLAVW